MRQLNVRTRKALVTCMSALGVATVLSGCPSSSSGPMGSQGHNPPPSQLPATMITSTPDSGLTLTIGMPAGHIADPSGNPITISTVPGDAKDAPAGYTRVQQDDLRVSYNGGWTRVDSAADFAGGSAVRSADSGAQVLYTFNGSAVHWIGYRGPASGIADVYLDGMRVATVDTYGTLPQSHVVLYSADGLTPGSHTLAIQVEGNHDAASSSAAVTVDAFDTAAAQTGSTQTGQASTEAIGNTVRIEQGNPAVAYAGSWTTASSSLLANYSGGSAAESPDGGAQATLSFTGTAVKWIGYTDTLSGIADVILDGSQVATVNTYSTLPASQVVLYSTSGLTAGSHTLSIRAEGKHSLLSLGSAVWVDAFDVTQPPPDTTPPTVSLTAPANGATISDTVTVSASASDNVGVVGVQFQLDGANLGSEDTSSPYSRPWDSTAVSDGSHTLTAIARDAAGNHTTSAPVTLTVSNGSGGGDTTPPSVSITAPANGTSVSGSVTVSADASDNVGVAGVQFQLDGTNLGAEDASAPYSISWNTTTIANGSHTLTAVARDAAGNIKTSAAVTVTVANSSGGDTTPPTVSMTAPADASTVTGTVTVSANASDNVGVAGVQFQLDGANLGAEDTASPYSSSWDSTTAANGTHTLTAIARDAAGNTKTSTPVTVTVSNGGGGDTTPPTVSMTKPADGSTVSGTVTVSANASDDVGVASVQFQLDGANLGAADTSAPYSISWDTTTASGGTHSLRAIAKDAAGNRTASTPVTVTVSNGGGGGTTTRIEQDNPAVAYSGTWVTASDSSVSGGSAAESNQANATATVAFTGTGITWIGYKCGCAAGIANVSVDGGAPTQVDNYSATTQPQAKVFTVSNLPSGNHTLKITVTGDFDRNGQTAYIVVDAFDVTN